MARKKWKGVEWAPIRNGKCTKHGCPVTPFLKMCFQCHVQQMKAAGHNIEEEDK